MAVLSYLVTNTTRCSLDVERSVNSDLATVRSGKALLEVTQYGDVHVTVAPQLAYRTYPICSVNWWK